VISLVFRIYNQVEENTEPRVNFVEIHAMIEMIFISFCASSLDAVGLVDNLPLAYKH
jgi:hypothetical protein